MYAVSLAVDADATVESGGKVSSVAARGMCATGPVLPSMQPHTRADKYRFQTSTWDNDKSDTVL